MSVVDFGLKDKVAIISGGSRGIGEAIARGFSEQGAKVVLASRKQEALDKVTADIKAKGGEAVGIAVHTGDVSRINSLYDQVLDIFGQVDILVNNAATNPFFGQMKDIPESAFDKTMDVNLKGYFFMAQRAANIMIEQGRGGAIINIASVAGITASPLQGVYGITKAGVIHMTKIFAVELAPEKIRVNAICPGLTRTHMTSVFFDNPDLLNIALERIPMGREAQPSEIVGAAVYLASEAASFTTGTVLTVDGGFLA